MGRRIETGGQHPLSDGHPDPIRETLSQWSRRGFDAMGKVPFRMPGGFRSELSEAPDILQRNIVTAQME